MRATPDVPSSGAGSTHSRSAIWGHPTGLPVLVSLKVWELFSYQGMRAFLVFYLIDAFGMRDDEATLVFGSYAALVLATSVLGGYCADRWLGAKESMAAGAALIMAGHCTLAIENLLTGVDLVTSAAGFQVFCAGLGFISVGTGLLKPNVLTMIGRLYTAEDPKREFGYYSYYIGVNIGAFAAPIVCGGLASRYGWTWGFGAAAIGMALGLLSFLIGRRWVTPVGKDRFEDTPVSVPRIRIYSAIAVTVLIAGQLVQNGLAIGLLLAGTLIAGAAVLILRASREPADLRLVLRFFLLLPIPMLFQILFEQLGTSMNLFSDRAVGQSLFGIAVTAPQLISLNSLFVLALLPPLAATWSALARRGREPSPFTKFAIGFAFIALAFAVLTVATRTDTTDARVSLLWVAVAYLMMTIGELCIAPEAFALVGRMLPDRYAGMAMGLTLLSFAAGNFLASLLAGAASISTTVSVAQAKAVYGGFFILPAAIAVGCVFVALVSGWLRDRGQQRTVPVNEARAF